MEANLIAILLSFCIFFIGQTFANAAGNVQEKEKYCPVGFIISLNNPNTIYNADNKEIVELIEHEHLPYIALNPEMSTFMKAILILKVKTNFEATTIGNYFFNVKESITFGLFDKLVNKIILGESNNCKFSTNTEKTQWNNNVII